MFLTIAGIVVAAVMTAYVAVMTVVIGVLFLSIMRDINWTNASAKRRMEETAETNKRYRLLS
jgi:hypothetical protein